MEELREGRVRDIPLRDEICPQRAGVCTAEFPAERQIGWPLLGVLLLTTSYGVLFHPFCNYRIEERPLYFLRL